MNSCLRNSQIPSKYHISLPRTITVAISVLSLSTLLIGAPPASAAGTPRKTATILVKGTLDCSNLLSVAGYGGSPSSLVLRSGSSHASVTFPRNLDAPGTNSIFGTPSLESYQFRVAKPKSDQSTKISYSLACRAADGSPAGTTKGSFSVLRSKTRDICNHKGLSDPCNPQLDTKLGNCAWSVFTAGVGSEALDAASTALDPPKTALAKAETALSAVTGPAGGILISCIPLAISSSSTTSTIDTAPVASGTGIWPTHRDDGSPVFFEYLGSSFIFPDWTSCDPSFCIAGSGGTVYVFTSNPLNQIGSVDLNTSNPKQALTSVGVPTTDAQALLQSSG